MSEEHDQVEVPEKRDPRRTHRVRIDSAAARLPGAGSRGRVPSLTCCRLAAVAPGVSRSHRGPIFASQCSDPWRALGTAGCALREIRTQRRRWFVRSAATATRPLRNPTRLMRRPTGTASSTNTDQACTFRSGSCLGFGRCRRSGRGQHDVGQTSSSAARRGRYGRAAGFGRPAASNRRCPTAPRSAPPSWPPSRLLPLVAGGVRQDDARVETASLSARSDGTWPATVPRPWSGFCSSTRLVRGRGRNPPGRAARGPRERLAPDAWRDGRRRPPLRLGTRHGVTS